MTVLDLVKIVLGLLIAATVAAAVTGTVMMKTDGHPLRLFKRAKTGVTSSEASPEGTLSPNSDASLP